MRQSRWLRRIAWTLGGVGALWVVGWLAVPPILKHQAEKIASDKLGRKVTLGAVDFKPWTLELTLRDLAIAKADGSADQLHIDRIYIDGELQSLLRLAPVVDAIQVDNPRVSLTHEGGGRYDVQDIIDRLGASPPADPNSKPARFALYNLALAGGSVDFVDNTVGRTHELRDLQINVPFLSNLDSQREVKVLPRLAFALNGSTFDSAAEGTPFAQSRKTDATIKLAGFDLAPYLGYIPASVPLKLQAATVDADVRVAFEQVPSAAQPMSVRLTGDVQVIGLKAADTQGKPLLAFDTLKIGLEDVRPLEQVVHLSTVELAAPQLNVQRDAQGQLNLVASGSPTAPAKTPEKIAAPASGASAAGQKDTKSQPPAPAWDVAVGQVAVNGASVAWRDATTTPAAQLDLRDLSLQAQGVAWPIKKAVPFSGSTALKTGDNGKGKAVDAGKLQFNGSVTAQAAQVSVAASAVPLSVARPYVAGFLEPDLDGTLSATLGLGWSAPALVVNVQTLTLDKLALTQGKNTVASLAKLQVGDTQIDLARRTVRVGSLALTDPRTSVERDKAGKWMYEQWLRQPASASAPATAEAPAAATAVAPTGTPTADAGPWSVTLVTTTVDGGTIAFRDASTVEPVSFDLSGLKLQVKDFAPLAKAGAAAAAKPSPLTVSGRIGAGRTEPGRFDFQGNFGLAPLAAQGQAQLTRLPVHAFVPYFADALNVEIRRAEASYKGAVRFASKTEGPSVQVQGDAALEELRVNSVLALPPAPATVEAAGGNSAPRGEPLLNWKALSLRGLDVALEPGKATAVNVKETTLSDFFARIIVFEDGRINLQDLVRSSAPVAVAPDTKVTVKTPTTTTTTGVVPTAPGTPVASVASAPESVASSAGAAVATAQNGTKSAAPAPVITFGPVALVNGRVAFSDRFVRPNYSANLSELTGKLSAFSSVAPDGAPQMADLELRGRAEGTASLEVLGKLNPLAKPLALDIKAKVRDLELAPMSPYSVKYSGHGIERGKLSVDVAYQILPNGQLTATNKIVLSQLVFGDAVEGAPASLPVRLATALLADSKGVIDIDLPVSGSVNDPQFSVGPVIFKALINLIVKAVTSPFSLLASALGGGDAGELSTVHFDAGSAVLTEEARTGLDKIAKALESRPALKMTVVGRASIDGERDDMKRQRLMRMLRAEKRRSTIQAAPASATSATAAAPTAAASAAGAADTPAAPLAISDAEYPELLTAVYKRADMAKPRNMVGLAKTLPVSEMEALLLANIDIPDDAVQTLATQRGVAVRDYLAKQKLPLDRLFLGAAKLDKSDEKATPVAELSLSTQ